MFKFEPKDNLLNQSNHSSVNIYYTYTSYAYNIQLKTRVLPFLVINKPERRIKKEVFKIHPHHAYISIQNEIINFN